MAFTPTTPEPNCADAHETQTLSDFPVGETVIVQDIRLEGKLRSYVMRFGLVEGARISVVRRVPLGALRVYRIGQSEIALRPETAKQIVATRNPQ